MIDSHDQKIREMLGNHDAAIKARLDAL
jgi:hypothetical protein